MIKDVVILGAGGFAKEVYEMVLDQGIYNMLGWIVDPQYTPPETRIYGFPVLGGFDWLEGKVDKIMAIPAIGPPELRMEFVRRCERYGIRLATVIHPSVSLSRWATLGEGIVVCHHCVIRNEVKLGRAVQINMECVAGHGVVMEDFATLAMGVQVTGGTLLGEGCYIGSGVTFSRAWKVGKWSRIGSGASVASDIPDNATAVGVPSKVVRVREEGWHTKIYS